MAQFITPTNKNNHILKIVMEKAYQGFNALNQP